MKECFNEWSGIIALVAAVASIASFFFGIWQYRKAQKQRLKAMQDELDILQSKLHFMYGLCDGKDYLSYQSRMEFLKKQLKRK